MSQVRRLLVKEVNWLGDLVMSLPALRVLRIAFPTASLTVLVRHELAGFFDGIYWLDEVIPYAIGPGVRAWTDQRKLIAMLHKQGFDLAVIFPNSFRSALWTSFARVPRRAGYATDGRRILLTDHAVPRASAKENHQSLYWLELVNRTLGIPTAIPGPSPQPLEVSQGSVVRARDWLAANGRDAVAPLIAIASGAAYGPAKEWPQLSYAELIDLLHKSVGAQCLLLGTTSERAKCQQLASMSRSRPIVAAGETDLASLKGLLSLCDGFAGNDSGAMHLAAALGIPTVGIFGSTNPARTGPLGPKTAVVYHGIECSPCLKRTCRYGHYKCLRSIAPGEIVAALTQLGAFVRPRLMS